MKTFSQYCEEQKYEIKRPIPSESEGGYLIPHFITVPRKGLIGYLARLFNNRYGWTKFDMHKALLSKKNIVVKHRIKL